MQILRVSRMAKQATPEMAPPTQAPANPLVDEKCGRQCAGVSTEFDVDDTEIVETWHTIVDRAHQRPIIG